ncbi:MAG: hypothetical protein HYS73_00980 [Parcubacteria group bacterium]|nr:hypothetical protein [Parcubacteria group bacterium]
MPPKTTKTALFLKTALVALVILSAVISPVGAGVAHAGWFEDLMLSLGGGALNTVSLILAEVVRVIIYLPSSLILRVAGFVFDAVVPFSLGIGGGTSVFASSFVTEGWGLMRDLTNMVFIFSLFLAQIVIYGTNLLALEFYQTLNDASNSHGIAAIVLSGFNPQKLLGTRSFESWVKETNQNYGVLLILYAFTSIIQFVGAYVIFWAAFLFVGRIVILWLLMILSPIAFAAYILPGTKGYFTKWWDALLKQAFVAPIFLFFLYILALFIHSGLPKSLAATAAQTGETGMTQIILEVAIGFSLVIAFMVYALKMTKSLGGEAAAWATKASGTAIGFAAGGIGGAVIGAGGGKRVAQLASMIPGVGGVVGKTLLGAGETVGRVGGAPLRAPLRAGGEKAASGARGIIEDMAKGVVKGGAQPTRGGALLRGLGIARGGAQIEATTKARVKADIEKAKKDTESLSVDALYTEYGYATTTAEKRAAIIEVLGKKKKLQPQEKGKGPMTHDSIVETIKTVKSRGYDTDKEIEGPYLWQYATTLGERKEAAKTLNLDALKEIGKAKREVIGADGKKEYLPSDFFDITKNEDGTENTEIFDIAIQNMTSAHLKVLLDPEVRADFSKKFVENLKAAMGRKKKEVTENMQKEGKTEKEIKDFEREFTADEYFKRIQNTRAAIKDPSLRNFFDDNDILYKEEKTKDGTGKEKTTKEEQKKSDEKEEARRKDEEEKTRRENFYQEFFGGEK